LRRSKIYERMLWRTHVNGEEVYARVHDGVRAPPPSSPDVITLGGENKEN
jgi:hypothetical protein